MTTATEEQTIVSAQVPVDLRDALARRARSADRTLSAEIRRCLAAAVSSEVAGSGAPGQTERGPGAHDNEEDA